MAFEQVEYCVFRLNRMDGQHLAARSARRKHALEGHNLRVLGSRAARAEVESHLPDESRRCGEPLEQGDVVFTAKAVGHPPRMQAEPHPYVFAWFELADGGFVILRCYRHRKTADAARGRFACGALGVVCEIKMAVHVEDPHRTPFPAAFETRAPPASAPEARTLPDSRRFDLIESASFIALSTDSRS